MYMYVIFLFLVMLYNQLIQVKNYTFDDSLIPSLNIPPPPLPPKKKQRRQGLQTTPLDSREASPKVNVSYTILYTVLYYATVYCSVLYCTVLYCTILYCTVLYCTVLYYTILYHTIPYHTMPYHTIPYHAISMILDQRPPQIRPYHWGRGPAPARIFDGLLPDYTILY